MRCYCLSVRGSEQVGESDGENRNSNAASSAVSSMSDENELKKAKTYFKDEGFERGMLVHSIDDGSDVSEVMRFDKAEETRTPFWSLSQFCSKFDILGLTAMDLGNGAFGYKNQGKTVGIVIEPDGSRALRLDVYGEKEYPVGEQRSNWPHLLACYEFSNSKPVSTYEKLVYTMDVRIRYCDNLMGESDSNAYCAQTTVYFTVQNLNRESEDYGQYYWFGLPVFDSRYTFPEAFHHMDVGEDRNATNQMIYVLGGEDFLREYYAGVNPADGQWAHLEIDILPYLKEGFEKAQENDRLKKSTWEDMALGSYNFGWEVPGTFNCGLDMRNIQLTAYSIT